MSHLKMNQLQMNSLLLGGGVAGRQTAVDVCDTHPLLFA
jgi:hypothetical protein